LYSSAPSSPGEKRPEKVGAKTGQGSAGAAGGVKAVGVKEEAKEKEEADRARFPVPLWRSPPSEVKQVSRGFAEFGLPGVANLMRAQRAASALNPLCAEGDGLRERWSGTRVEGMRFTALKGKGVDHAHVDRVQRRGRGRTGGAARVDEFEVGPPGNRRP